MRRLLVAALAVASFAWLTCLSLRATQDVTGDTRLLAHATYVTFGYGAEGSFVSSSDSGKAVGVSQEDRDALVNIRTQFEQWRRYSLTEFAKNAELLVAVRVGRRGAVGGRAPVGGGQPGTGVTGFGVGVGSPDDDTLSVYSSAGGRTRALIWRKAIPNGLSGSPSPLFEELRRAVEAASK